METKTPRSKLIETIRVPKGIRVNLFECCGEYGVYYEARVSRAYTKGGEVKFTESLRLNDLPFVEHATRMAFEKGLALLDSQRGKDPTPHDDAKSDAEIVENPPL